MRGWAALPGCHGSQNACVERPHIVLLPPALPQTGHSAADLADADRFYLSDAYKHQVVSAMSISQLIEICLINPTVTLLPSYRDTGLTASYTFEPLSNLVYTRDQQITTCRGIVMGRLRSAQRQKEVELMSFCFQKLGALACLLAG